MTKKIKSKSHYDTSGFNTLTKEEPYKEDCVKYVVDCWESWSEHWANKMTDFEKYYDRWIGAPPKRDEDWQANFHKRLTWQAEKTLVARLHGALFPNSAPIDTTRTEATDDLQGILGKSIVSHWFKIGEFSKEFLSGMRSSAIYGTGLFEDDWYVRKELVQDKKEIMIPDYRPMVDEGGKTVLDEEGRVKSQQIGTKPYNQIEKKLKVVEDRYRVRKANIFSWRIHPSKLTDEDDYPAIKQEFVTYNDLLERQAELAKYGITAFDSMEEIENDEFKIKEEDAKRYSKDGEYLDEKNPRIEILHYWGLYAEQEGDDGYQKGSKKRPIWIMVVNRKYKIKLIDNPYWHKKPPLFHINWSEDEKPSYYGIGLSQIGADAEDRANSVVNIRTDIKKKTTRGTGWYNANDKKIKKSQLTSNIPGLMRPCSDVNAAVRYDVIPGPDQTDYREEEIAVNDHREITGATTSLLPTADKNQQHKTLGGMEILVGQGLQRLKPDLQMMEIMGIRKMANRGFLLTRQFFTQPQMIELMAPEDKLRQMNLSKMYQLTPREIMGSINFFCTGLSEAMDKAQNIDKLLKFTEITGKIPQMAQMMNYQEIGKQIGIWLGFEDVDRFMNMNQMPPVPPQPQQQPPMPGQIPPPMPGMPPGIRPPPGIPPPGMQRPPMPMQRPLGIPQRPMLPQGGNGGIPPGMMQGISPQIMAAIQARMNGVPPR